MCLNVFHGFACETGEVCIALGEGKCPAGTQRADPITAQCWWRIGCTSQVFTTKLPVTTAVNDRAACFRQDTIAATRSGQRGEVWQRRRGRQAELPPQHTSILKSFKVQQSETRQAGRHGQKILADSRQLACRRLVEHPRPAR